MNNLTNKELSIIRELVYSEKIRKGSELDVIHIRLKNLTCNKKQTPKVIKDKEDINKSYIKLKKSLLYWVV